MFARQALDVLMKILAPILPHTSEEVYQHLIGIDELVVVDDGATTTTAAAASLPLRSVFQVGCCALLAFAHVRSRSLGAHLPLALAQRGWPTIGDAKWAMSDADVAEWTTLLAVRDAVNAALEVQRGHKYTARASLRRRPAS